MARYQSLICDDEERRQAVIDHPDLNGIDAIEVPATSLDAQRFLQVYFLKPDFINDLVGHPELLNLEGGVRVQNIRIRAVTRVADHLVVEVDQPGDFSTYTLTVQSPWIDPAFGCKAFSFKAGCPSDFDCRREQVCPEQAGRVPLIDYMAKDYASFRQALLDLIPSLAPDWLERHEADLGIALVELLAYVGDHLSYYQDAVANEAYLETARQRISMRRHARLIDYRVHDGASARAFVHVAADEPGTLPAATPVLTRITSPLGGAVPGPVIGADLHDQAEAAAGAVFETMGPAYVHHHLNEIWLYPWSNLQCCLPRGATAIDLYHEQLGNLTPYFSAGHFLDSGGLAGKLRDAADPVSQYIHDQFPPATQLLLAAYADGDPVPSALLAAIIAGLNDLLPDDRFYAPTRFLGIHLSDLVRELIDRNPTGAERIRLNRFLLEAAYADEVLRSPKLLAGDYLLFEEIYSPETGLAADADPAHRQIVRLTAARPLLDPLNGQELTGVTWDAADKLAFPLCLSALTTREVEPYEPHVSVARANLILADHGQTLAAESHSGPEAPRYESQRRAHRFLLDHGPLSFQVPSPADNGSLAPAVRLLATDPRQATPQVLRLEVSGTTPSLGLSDDWQPVDHLLDSDEFAHDFAVETDNDGRPLIRFGDGEYGLAPPDGSTISVDYRVGVGRAGNVGAESLAHLVDLETGDDWPDVSGVRNPLPAWGGIDSEPMAEVKRLAPAAFHAEQKRAVTEADYAAAAEQHPAVANAVATFRWTGSWHTVFLTIDPAGRTDLPQELQDSIRDWVVRFTQAGYDLEIDPPTFVPLEIEVGVCVAADHFRGHVEEAVLDALSNRLRSNGQRGFFHPDNFTFGQPLYLSQLYAAIEAVEGVDSAEVKVFQRFGKLPNNELEQGYVPIGRLEVVRLDNDPDFQENGVLRLNMLGGK
jgi:hypothetical protein